MKLPLAGAIDCDLHPGMPSVPALLPYLDDYWRDQLANRHIDKLPFTLSSYPLSSPLSARPDWRAASGSPGGDLDAIRRQALDPFRVRYAICNPLHGAVALFNEDMAAALCAAINDWMARELLDREPRLRALILVPAQSPELAVREIARMAPDRRFVQVLLLAMGETPLGRRAHWPIYAAAETHELVIGIHAGSTYRGGADIFGLDLLPRGGLRGAIGGLRDAVAEPRRRGRVPEIPQSQGGADRVGASPGCRRGSGVRPRPGAGCARRRRGSTGRRRRSCASMCGSRCSRWMRREAIRLPWRAPWSTWARTGCCCSPPTIRIGSSTARTPCLTGCPGTQYASCSSTMRSRPTRVCGAPQQRSKAGQERDGGLMNIAVRQAAAAQRLKIVDCDIHPVYRTTAELHPFMSARWREHMATFGTHFRHGLTGQLPYPRMMAAGMRMDLFPEDGPPGSDLELMRKQHLDANGVEVGMLIALSRGGMEERNLDFGAALSSAINDWQLECWVKKEPRLRAAIVVPQENAEYAVAEIERRADDPAFVQIMISPRSSDPLGHRRYWPIYAAAERCGKPLCAACRRLQRWPSVDGLGLAHLLHPRALRHVDGHAEHACEPGVRGRARALPEAQDRNDRGRLRLAAGVVLAHGQALAAHARRDAASQASSVRVCPPALLVHDAADRGARGPPASGATSWNGSVGTS